MKREEQRAGRRLGHALQNGDPATFDSAMTDDERGRIRARLMDVWPETSPSLGHGWLKPVFAVGVGLLVLTIAWNWTIRERSSAPVPKAARVENAPDRVETDGHEVQQVRFVTSGGTQIIWLLNPDLTL
jgi:hypothetical protein